MHVMPSCALVFSIRSTCEWREKERGRGGEKDRERERVSKRKGDTGERGEREGEKERYSHHRIPFPRIVFPTTLRKYTTYMQRHPSVYRHCIQRTHTPSSSLGRTPPLLTNIGLYVISFLPVYLLRPSVARHHCAFVVHQRSDMCRLASRGGKKKGGRKEEGGKKKGGGKEV